MQRLVIEVGDDDVFKVVDDPNGTYVAYSDAAAELAALTKQHEARVAELDEEIAALKLAGDTNAARVPALESELKLVGDVRSMLEADLEKAREDRGNVSALLDAARSDLVAVRVQRDQYAAQLRSIRNIVDVALPRPKNALEDKVDRFLKDVQADSDAPSSPGLSA